MSNGNDNSKPFKIGLVMAGAISAGSYTAGVIDFLIEALDSWQKAKDNDKESGELTVPPHNIEISVISGASAGGMTAAITAASLQDEPPSTDDPEQKKEMSKFYKAWVGDISLKGLLENEDLEGGKDIDRVIGIREGLVREVALPQGRGRLDLGVQMVLHIDQFDV